MKVLSVPARHALGLCILTILLVGCPPPQPNVAPPPAADAVAFFVRFGPDLLVPLGCKRLDQTRWDQGRTCVSLVESAGKLELEDIGPVEAVGPAPTQCAQTGHGTTALAVRRPGAPLAFPERPAFGVWATSTVPHVIRASEEAPTAPLDVSADPVIAALWEQGGATILQQAMLDLEQDGVQETIAVVRVGPPGDDALEGVQSAIIVRDAEQTRVVHPPTDGRYQLLGFADLDNDAQSEVWLRLDTVSSRTDRLESWTRDGVVEVGAWGCP